MKIGILECGHPPVELSEKHGNYDQMFARLLDGNGFDIVGYDTEHGVLPKSITECDGWLISGSKHGVYEDHAFIPPLEDFVREVYAAGIPMVGICFGHQIIAQALGGKVVKFDGGWAVGKHVYDFGDGEDTVLNAWHQDQVVELPEGAEVIARSPFCENAALVYGDKAFTVQPHPEMKGAFIADLVALRRGTGSYPDDRMDQASAQAHEPNHDYKLAKQIAEFFLKSRPARN